MNMFGDPVNPVRIGAALLSVTAAPSFLILNLTVAVRPVFPSGTVAEAEAEAISYSIWCRPAGSTGLCLVLSVVR